MREPSENMLSRYEQPIGTSGVEVAAGDRERRRMSRIREFEPHSIAAPLILTTILCLFAAVTIPIATWYFWDMPYGHGTRQVLLCVFNGMLLSLPVLISLWMVLGGPMWIIRIPLASFCLVSLLAIYLATFNLLDSSIPSEVVFVISGITLAVSAVTQIPLWFVRIRYGASITRKSFGSTAKKQFTIKQLLITTTIFAFIVPVLQWIVTLSSLDGEEAPLGEICGFCGIFIAVLAFLTLLSVLFVFMPKLRVTCLGLLVVGIVVLPFAVVPSINYVIGRGVSNLDVWDMGINVFTFSLSNTIAMIVVMSMYYALGFRLRTQHG